MKKSYHSIVVPTRLAPTTRRIGDVVAGGGLVAVIVRVSLRGAWAGLHRPAAESTGGGAAVIIKALTIW